MTHLQRWIRTLSDSLDAELDEKHEQKYWETVGELAFLVVLLRKLKIARIMLIKQGDDVCRFRICL